MVWHGLTGHVDLSRHSARVDINASAPLLRVESTNNDNRAGGTIELVDLQWNSHAERIFNDLYAGLATVTLANLRGKGPGDSIVESSGVRYEAALQVDGEFVDGIVRAGAEKLLVGKQQYGPSHYNISLRHLHAPTLAALMRELRSLGEQRASTAQPGSPAVFDDASLRATARQLLLANPRFAIDDISGNSPAGPFSVKGEAHFADLQSSDLVVPLLMLRKIEGHADVRVPAVWATRGAAQWLPAALPLERADSSTPTDEFNVDELGSAAGGSVSAAEANGRRALDLLVRRGYLKRDGELVVTHVELRQGKLFLNGRAFDN